MEQEDFYLTHVRDENGVPQAPEDGGSDDSDEETEPEDLGDAGDGEPAGAASASSVEGVRRGRSDVWPFPMARKASPAASAHAGKPLVLSSRARANMSVVSSVVTSQNSKSVKSMGQPAELGFQIIKA